MSCKSKKSIMAGVCHRQLTGARPKKHKFALSIPRHVGVFHFTTWSQHRSACNVQPLRGAWKGLSCGQRLERSSHCSEICALRLNGVSAFGPLRGDLGHDPSRREVQRVKYKVKRAASTLARAPSLCEAKTDIQGHGALRIHKLFYSGQFPTVGNPLPRLGSYGGGSAVSPRRAMVLRRCAALGLVSWMQQTK